MTKVVKVGNLLLGGGNPVLVQSMTNTDTRDTEATLQQIRALADEIEFRLEPYGIAPHHIEGADTGVWVLEDFGPVIVHLFNSEGREFYNLDKLYQDTTERDISALITED